MRWASTVRVLIYPVMFERRPRAAVDYVLDTVIDDPDAGLDREAIAAHLDEALSSNYPLASLLEQDHDEEVIREYLAAVRERLRPKGTDTNG